MEPIIIITCKILMVPFINNEPLTVTAPVSAQLYFAELNVANM